MRSKYETYRTFGAFVIQVVGELMNRVLQPQLKRSQALQRAALLLALTLIGVLCGSMIHGIRTLTQ